MTSEAPRSARRPAARLGLFWGLILAATASVLILYAVQDLELAFFTHDSEAELLAVTSILDSGFTRVSIPWTRAYGSFQEELLPFGENFVSVHDHRLYASRPLLFLFATGAMYRVFGAIGLYLLPALAAFGAIHFGYRVTRSLPGPVSSPDSAVWVLPLLAFTTPILFYGLCYWNMIVGGALSTWAVYLLLRDKGPYAGPLAGCVFGVGAGIRPELSLLAIPLAVWTWRQHGFKKTAGLALGLLAAAAAVSLLNYAVFGSPFGPHLAGNRIPLSQWLHTRPRVLYDLFLTSLRGPWVEGIAAGVGLLALLPSSVSVLGAKSRTVLLWVFALGSGWIALGTFTSPDPFTSSLETHSLLACAPFLFLAFHFPAGEDRRLRALRWLTVTCLLLAALFCPPQAAHAAHWGPRVFVGFLPLVGVSAYSAAVAYAGVFRGRWVRLAIGALVLVGLANQAYSLKLLYYKKHESAVFKEEMRAVDLPIVSDQWVVPADLASWYPRRALWLPRSTTDLERIFENLRRSGEERMVVVVRDGSSLDRYMQGLVARGQLRAESRRPIRSRLFHYTGMSATVYGTSR